MSDSPRAAPRAILHVDMDAFFASVEVRDRPELRGKPVLVGGASHRGVVAAASYEARRYGVFSAMPMAKALRLCPKAIVLSPRRGRYEEASGEVFAIFRRYTPQVEGLSLDEAFLDVTASQSLFGDGPAIAARIRSEIHAELGLTCSAGVAGCKFAAKIASDVDKPNGLTVVPADVAAFLAPLPIERMWGVGPKTAPRLRALGYATIGDLARADAVRLETALGSWAREVIRLASGDDPRDVEPDRPAKSISTESTYENDLVGRVAIERALLEHATVVARRLVSGGLSARTLTIKLKRADFTLVTRRITFDSRVADTKALHREAARLLDRIPLDGQRFRLVGLGVSELTFGGPTATLFDQAEVKKNARLEQVLLAVQRRFGDDAEVKRATLLEGPGVVVPTRERV